MMILQPISNLVFCVDHTPSSSHTQQQSSYSQYDNHENQQHLVQQPYRQPTTFNPEAYNQTAALVNIASGGVYGSPDLSTSHYPPLNPSASPPPPQFQSQMYSRQPYQSNYHQPERNYSLGGDGYGANSVPPLGLQPNYHTGAAPSFSSSLPSPYDNIPLQHNNSAPLGDDAPPGYDKESSTVQGQWGKH